MAPGLVDVTVIDASQLKETEVFGKQDPYAIITIGSTKRQTKVCKDGGKSARWNETFQFTVSSESQMRIEVFNKNGMGKDDLIGYSDYNLVKAFSYQQDACSIPISRSSGKPSGTVNMHIRYTPLGGHGGHPGQQPGYPVQQPGYPPQQPGYPPQQPGYPPQQGGYPPQSGAYPPHPGGHPPQQGGYPPQPGGYPPQPGAYPPQPGGYPAAHGATNVPSGYHGYTPPPAGYPGGAPYDAYGQKPGGQSSSSSAAMMYGAAGMAAGAAMGAGGMYAYQHSHGKHGKHGGGHYKHKGYKHKGYKHKGHKHKGWGKKWKKK